MWGDGGMGRWGNGGVTYITGIIGGGEFGLLLRGYVYIMPNMIFCYQAGLSTTAYTTAYTTQNAMERPSLG